jgi:hypothetical protein
VELFSVLCFLENKRKCEIGYLFNFKNDLRLKKKMFQENKKKDFILKKFVCAIEMIRFQLRHFYHKTNQYYFVNFISVRFGSVAVLRFEKSSYILKRVLSLLSNGLAVEGELK